MRKNQKKTKQYTDVADMMADILPEDPDFTENLKEQIANRRLVRELTALRCEKKVSQTAVAKEMGHRQNYVSRLENGLDGDIRIRDIEAYARSLGFGEVEISLRSEKFTLVEQVKYHAFRILACFERMRELAKNDEVMASGMAKFHVEAIFNIVKIIRDSAKKMPKIEGDPHTRLAVPETEADMLCEDSAADSSIDDRMATV